MVVKISLFLLYSSGHGKYLMVKTTPTPDVVDDDDNHYAAPLQIPLPKMSRGFACGTHRQV
jgi:hypothetical protein